MKRSIDQVIQRAREAEQRGRLSQAERLYSRVLDWQPEDSRARAGIRRLQRQAGSHRMDRGDSLGPQLKPLVGLYQQRQYGRLAEEAGRLARDYPRSVAVRNLLGAAYGGLGELERAAACFEQAIEIDPGQVDAHNNLGNTLKCLGRLPEAVACFERAISLCPDQAEPHNNLAVTLQGLGAEREALVHFRRAMELQPERAESYNNVAILLFKLGERQQALEHFQQALELAPEYAEAWHNLGNVMYAVGERAKASQCFARAVRLKPAHAGARAEWLHQLAGIGDWDGIGQQADRLESLGISGAPVAPFSLLSLEDAPERHRQRAERFAADRFRVIDGGPLRAQAAAGRRLRIGYFSADFYEHAMMHLMARLFELHDRREFEVHLFSYGPPVHDAMRRRVSAAADMFHDVHALSDAEVAMQARKLGLDIAVDLSGYTRHSRLGIFAQRAAPTQVSYLGYPGTTGAPFIDYMLADRVIIPEADRRYYSERIVYLPYCYQINDNTRAISERPMSRAEMGLPEQAIVLCCFNNSFKIGREEFGIWMRMLLRSPGSVLWLLRANETAEQNLRREAVRCGVDSSRLIFADRVPLSEHLARHRLADLFVDTFHYNAHTTASDALWAGLPLVTRMGRGFAARVAASLLQAIGLPELVTDSSQDYERLVCELISDSKRLADVRERLAVNRDRTPLFDTQATTRELERIFTHLHRSAVTAQVA